MEGEGGGLRAEMNKETVSSAREVKHVHSSSAPWPDSLHFPKVGQQAYLYEKLYKYINIRVHHNQLAQCAIHSQSSDLVMVAEEA